jgi:hypothetical protein
MAKDAKSKRLAQLVAAKWTLADRLDGDDTCKPGNPDPAHLDRATRAAFAAFKLKPHYPGHWLFLACVLANVVFGRMKAGAPKRRWDERRLGQLRIDVAAARRGGRTGKISEVCNILKNDALGKFDGRYKGMSVDALRHKVRNIKVAAGDN